MPIIVTDPFISAFAHVIGEEAGFVDHPRDPGGATNLGVSLRYAKSKGRVLDLDHDGDVDVNDIRLVTLDDARALYRQDFWLPAGCHWLPEPLALVVFDSAVNCGAGRAARWLQTALRVTADGVVGPRTIAVAQGLVPAGLLVEAIADVLAARNLHNVTTGEWATFGLGWSRRLFRLAMAAQTLIPEGPAA
ncbi:glycoside hydrolase family 108 protein [Humitalea sp. 24SJ18S-53]|uniref:glycoside hydrolase family 108 protein n=1 Tax=Humitalea sp. 24SJ18S-53 TaxID=3422307 RepID=UPI003D66E3F3